MLLSTMFDELGTLTTLMCLVLCQADCHFSTLYQGLDICQQDDASLAGGRQLLHCIMRVQFAKVAAAGGRAAGLQLLDWLDLMCADKPFNVFCQPECRHITA